MTSFGLLMASGRGRSHVYAISTSGRVFAHVDATVYSALEPDKRYGLAHFNFDLLPAFPSDLFTVAELARLEEATNEYHKRTNNLSETIRKKELERLIIELSWKSSKIEGNTYTLLDTEKLILENKEIFGYSKSEARMILNHKDAFTYIYKYSGQFKTLTRKNLEQIHALLVGGMNVGLEIRTKPVGVLGSKYRPLDNAYQLADAVEALSLAVAKMETPYAKALLSILGVSYLQPFEDGNKRTSRLIADALLMAHQCAPLSYRSVDEVEYREAVIVFYELNSITSFKKIFIEQYIFAAKNYAVG